MAPLKIFVHMASPFDFIKYFKHKNLYTQEKMNNNTLLLSLNEMDVLAC